VLSPADEKSGKSARHPSNIVISTEAKRSGEIAAFSEFSQLQMLRSLRYGGKKAPPPVEMTNIGEAKECSLRSR